MANKTGRWHEGMSMKENDYLLSSGAIDYDTYFDNRYMITRERTLPLLYEYFNNQQWDKFINTALCKCEVLPDAFYLYDRIPDNLKYEFAICAYTHHGDSIPAVRKAVRSALKYGKPILPKELATADDIIVYRAGEEPIEKAKYRISWTTDKKVAEFFLNDYGCKHAKCLYEGKIKPDKIIAYTNDRKEKEIMQYANVYDIKIIAEV